MSATTKQLVDKNGVAGEEDEVEESLEVIVIFSLFPLGPYESGHHWVHYDLTSPFKIQKVVKHMTLHAGTWSEQFSEAYVDCKVQRVWLVICSCDTVIKSLFDQFCPVYNFFNYCLDNIFAFR